MYVFRLIGELCLGANLRIFRFHTFHWGKHGNICNSSHLLSRVFLIFVSDKPGDGVHRTASRYCDKTQHPLQDSPFKTLVVCFSIAVARASQSYDYFTSCL